MQIFFAFSTTSTKSDVTGFVPWTSHLLPFVINAHFFQKCFCVVEKLSTTNNYNPPLAPLLPAEVSLPLANYKFPSVCGTTTIHSFSLSLSGTFSADLPANESLREGETALQAPAEDVASFVRSLLSCFGAGHWQPFSTPKRTRTRVVDGYSSEWTPIYEHDNSNTM